jgi:hypothetical protein
MRFLRQLGWLVLAMVACGAAHAQLGVYGMGSGGYLSSVTAASGPLTLTSQSFGAYGGTFGVYKNFYKLGPVRFGADGRGFFQSSVNNNAYGNQLRGGLGGARLSLFSKAAPFSPYVQGEVGVASTNYGTSSQRSSSFAYQISGGLDYTIIPRLDARFEYGDGQISAVYSGYRQTMQQVGLGLVLRFK